MQNAAIAALGLDWVYIPWAVRPEVFLKALDALREIENFGGANVTIKPKEAALWSLNELSPDALHIGAVNTIVPRGRILVGHNMDGEGFVTSLREEAGEEPRGKRVGLIGAGGGDRARADALARAEAAERGIFRGRQGWGRCLVAH